MKMRSLPALALIAALAFTPACATLTAVGAKVPSQVQLVVASGDTVDSLNQLGDVVLQLSSQSHALHKAGVLPVEADNTVQKAAVAFADGKDTAVADVAKAQTTLQVIAAAAPLLGQITTITTILKPLSGAKVAGPAGLITAQLPATLKTVGNLVKQAGGQ
jgi:biopolymer transport protein ExbB/TolQ